MTSQTFIVPIYYTPAETNAANRVITLTLSNPNPAAITNGSPFPKTATITILDNQLVTGAPGSVDTTLLTGTGFNNVVNSLSFQPDGSLLAGGLFTFVNQYPLLPVGAAQPGWVGGHRVSLPDGGVGRRGADGAQPNAQRGPNRRLDHGGRAPLRTWTAFRATTLPA